MNPSDQYQTNQNDQPVAPQAAGQAGAYPNSQPVYAYPPAPVQQQNPYQSAQQVYGYPPQAMQPAAPQQSSAQSTQGNSQQGPPPKPKNNPNSTQNTLLLSEIRDGIVIMNDGSFRSVIMLKSINFDLMNPSEQEAVEYAYQSFLNSLYFPIQIFIRSEKVDLQPYIQKLDKIRTEHDNMLLAMLMDDYTDYIEQLSQQTNIMNKRFYLVIPYFPHVEVQKALTQSKNFFSGVMGMFNSKETHVVINEADLQDAKDELRNRVQAVLGGLMQCGVQGLPLDTQELIELYYNCYNPETAPQQGLISFDNLTADIVTKGSGTAPQAHLSGGI